MPDLGNKYECAECGAKFYDLGKPEPLCPKCGTDARLHQQEAKRPSTEARIRYVAPPPTPVAEEADDDAVDDIAEDDEEILEVMPGEVEEEEDDDED
jgi:predicted  nucleic acid-binding Zn-ribbon protein